MRARLDELLEGDGGRAHLRRVEERAGREVARFVSLQRELRARAGVRFPNGRLLAMTSKGLEQATAAPVADLRATRFAAELGGTGRVAWDASSGIGSDAVALARAGVATVASDLDGDALRCAATNLAELGGAAVRADARRLPLEGGAAVLLDPDRRSEGRRTLDPRDWSPTLAESLGVVRGSGLGCIKLPPGLDLFGSGLDRAGDVTLEWVSLQGEARELAAWVGDWGWRSNATSRRAVALRRDGAIEICEGDGAEAAPEEARLDEGMFLTELDPVLGLSGLAAVHGARHGLAPMEGGAGYWIAKDPLPVPMTRSWRVLAVVPLDRKKVRALLREHGVGPLTVKSRGVRESADSLGARLRVPGERSGILAVTRAARGTVAALLEAPRSATVVGDEGLEPPAPSL